MRMTLQQMVLPQDCCNCSITRDYGVLYDRWHRGELNRREVLLYYGAEVLDMMLAQEAVAEDADREMDTGPIVAGPVTTAMVRGMQHTADHKWVRFGFAQFEVVYGRWKLKEVTDEEVAESYGDDWVRVVSTVEGLGVAGHLGISYLVCWMCCLTLPPRDEGLTSTCFGQSHCRPFSDSRSLSSRGTTKSGCRGT